MTVHLEDDIVDLQTGLAGGGIMVDARNLHAMNILELQGSRLFFGDVPKIDAEIALRAPAWKTDQAKEDSTVQRSRLSPRWNSIQQTHACCKNQNADRSYVPHLAFLTVSS
jgi:hypothetical protein